MNAAIQPSARIEPTRSHEYRYFREYKADIAADPKTVFALLDDHSRLAGHMEKPSLMMAGATMKFETDDRHGRALGSVIRMRGRVLGIPLFVEETVIDYVPSFQKAWETRGNPRLLVVGGYRMGFKLTPQEKGTRLRVWIAYEWPRGILGHWLGWMFGDIYAEWCVKKIVQDATHALSNSNA